MTPRLLPLLAALAVWLLQDPAPNPPPAPVEVAVIVHPENKVSDPTREQLRTWLTLERQFWPEGRRVVIYLRPAATPEMEVLLKKVYRMTEPQLRQYWIRRLHTGEIPAAPSVLRSAAAASKEVKETPGGLSIVPAAEVPAGVRVFRVDGKRPGEKGYPLVWEAAPK